jgi:phage baseplate assembly protein V
MIETLRESLATLRFGFVTAVDAATHRVRVRLPDLDDLETYWLPVLVARTHQDHFEHLPDVGEHVALLLDPRGEEGVVLGALYSARDPSPGGSSDITRATFADGTTVEYDRAAHRLLVSVRGPVTIIADGAVQVQAPSVTLDTPSTTCTGHALIQGRLTVQGGIRVSGGGGAAASISGNVHVDGNIDASGSIMDGGGNSNHHSH